MMMMMMMMMYMVQVNSEGSGENAWMRRLTLAFAGHKT